MRAVRSRLEANRLAFLVNTTEQGPGVGVHTLGLESYQQGKKQEAPWLGEGLAPLVYTPLAVDSRLDALGDAAVDTGHRNCPAAVS